MYQVKVKILSWLTADQQPNIKWRHTQLQINCLLPSSRSPSPPPVYLCGGALLLNLRFTLGSSVAGGPSIIQPAWTIEAGVASQLPCSRQIRQRTKLFMMEEWTDGDVWSWMKSSSSRGTCDKENKCFQRGSWLTRTDHYEITVKMCMIMWLVGYEEGHQVDQIKSYNSGYTIYSLY